LKILWETDKLNFMNSNLECVQTHSKFQPMKFSLSIFHKIYKIWNQFFLMWKFKIRAFDWWVNHIWIASGCHCSRKVAKLCFETFIKIVLLSALLNFTSLHGQKEALQPPFFHCYFWTRATNRNPTLPKKKGDFDPKLKSYELGGKILYFFL
jgi:hypothetical protein